MAATISKDFELRFFYFVFACLLYSIWRAVDLLVQVELTGEYEHASVMTSDNTFTLLKRGRGSGRETLNPVERRFPEWQRCWWSPEIV